MKEKDTDIIEQLDRDEYKYGFTSDIETEYIRRGLDEGVVRLISQKKGEPEWLLELRLKAFRHWQTMEMPTWAHLNIPEIDFQDIIYYAAPKKQQPKAGTVEDIDPELKRTFDKLGIPLEEQLALSGVAVDAVMDSTSVKTTFKETLAEKGIIFCSTIPNWCASISARWCRMPITSTRHSTLRSSRTARSAISRRGCVALWSSRPTSALMLRVRVSSSER